MSHNSLSNYNLGILVKFSLCNSVSGIYSLNLNSFHFHISTLFYIYNSCRVHNIFTIPIAFAIMLFNILYSGILTNVKCMNSIVSGKLVPTIVNSASCYYKHICTFTNMEIIIYTFLQTCLADYNRDVHTFIFCSRLNININAVFVFFSYNIYICSCISAILFAICPDIISTGRNLM